MLLQELQPRSSTQLRDLSLGKAFTHLMWGVISNQFRKNSIEGGVATVFVFVCSFILFFFLGGGWGVHSILGRRGGSLFWGGPKGCLFLGRGGSPLFNFLGGRLSH